MLEALRKRPTRRCSSSTRSTAPTTSSRPSLLEFLSDFQISIPERGTVRAHEPPVVILTSNRTRELHEALRRRCVYHWIDYPDPEREAQIVMLRASTSPRRRRGRSSPP